MDSPSAACPCGYSAMACSKALNEIYTVLVFVCCLAREGWVARARLAPAGKKCHLKTCGQGETGGASPRQDHRGAVSTAQSRALTKSPPFPHPSAKRRAAGCAATLSPFYR